MVYPLFLGMLAVTLKKDSALCPSLPVMRVKIERQLPHRLDFANYFSRKTQWQDPNAFIAQ
jgi:hypothetical protein